ncbi:MAG: MBL fold metallo-hydrolase [Dehalococcoidia bacterium]|nr:MBL fold metallo-hydrolase [Dehalococcoidia bacterium]
MGQFHRTQVGNAELIALQDSWAVVPPSFFYPDVPVDAWADYREFLDANGNLTHNIGAWLVVSEGNAILVDTGLGGRPVATPLGEAPALPSVMEAAGAKPEDIDRVVYTHLHFDHTGWNTIDDAGAAIPLFPNARHVVQRAEWNYWSGSDELRAVAQYDNVLWPIESAGLLDLVEGEYAVTSELVALPTPGHTPGHVSFVLASAGERAYLIGDVAHQPVQVREDGWTDVGAVDSVAATATRKALFARIEEESALIAGGHFPFPGLGHAVSGESGRTFRPLSAGP